MTEVLIYLGISLLSLLLFAFWYSKQGQTAEKKWLLSQLAQADDSSQQQYLESLKRLEKQPSSTGRMSLLAALLIIPATFLIDYLWFHDIPLDQRVSVAESQANGQEVPDLATAIKQLEQKLDENPEDLQGQMLYGQTMMSIRDYGKAVLAYQKANELEPNNANILTELAEAIAFRNNTGSFLGEPEQYLNQATAVDPKNQKAMWLQGIVYYETEQYHEAEAIWTDLLTLVENPKVKSTISKQINQARSALNKPPIDMEPVAETLFTVVIDADETVQALTMAETAKLFVFAKQTDGSPMPIAAAAISKHFEWPMTIKLSDQNSLRPDVHLSQFEHIELSAKISLTGDASDQQNSIEAQPQIVTKETQKIEIKLTKNHD